MTSHVQWAISYIRYQSPSILDYIDEPSQLTEEEWTRVLALTMIIIDQDILIDILDAVDLRDEFDYLAGVAKDVGRDDLLNLFQV